MVSISSAGIEIFSFVPPHSVGAYYLQLQIHMPFFTQSFSNNVLCNAGGCITFWGYKGKYPEFFAQPILQFWPRELSELNLIEKFALKNFGSTGRFFFFHKSVPNLQSRSELEQGNSSVRCAIRAGTELPQSRRTLNSGS